MSNKYITLASTSIATYESVKTDLVEKIKNLEITDESSVKEGKDTLKSVNTLLKTIKTKEDEALEPLKNLVNDIKKIASDFTLDLEKSKSLIKEKLLAFEEEKQRQQQEAVEKMKADLGVEVTPEAKTYVSNVRVRDEVVIIDESLVPRDFCSPDLKKIKAALKLGIEIPGVKVNKIKSVQ